MRSPPGLIVGESGESLIGESRTCAPSTARTDPSAASASSSAARCLATSSSVTRPEKALAATRRAGTAAISTSELGSGSGGASANRVGSTNDMSPAPSAAAET